MKRLLFILLLLFVLLSMFAFGAEEKTFSLQECLAIALKNNITLGIKVVQVERQEGLLKQAKEKFLPALTFQLGKAKTNGNGKIELVADQVPPGHGFGKRA